ncbi:MAG: hypothetical protein WC026_17245 [Hyphomicrobium sp.]|uniref:hypothetical protein n=1 Tax=Hyphomicrobium sp. TaxID=82 RepID=UPI003562AA23
MQGYRTYLVALLPTIFGLLQMTDWNAFMNDPKAGLVGIGSGLLMAVMRSITSTPPGVK